MMYQIWYKNRIYYNIWRYMWQVKFYIFCFLLYFAQLYNFNNKMGINQSINKQSELVQLKRQNHPILGQLTLLQHPITKKIFNSKHTIHPQQLIPKSLQINNNKDESTINRDKPYIQIQHIGNNSPVLMSCASQQSCTIIIDSVEVDLQTIQNSTLFKGFNQNDLVNIMENVLDAIVLLNSMKIGIFPVCEKSVVVSGQEEYQGEDLSKVIFKVIPNQLVKFQNVKQFHKIIIVPPEIQQSYTFLKQQTYLSYSPKNQIYCLGVLILNLIAGHTHPQRTLDISFGNESASILNFQVGTKENDLSDLQIRGQLVQKWIALQENPNFSVQFKKIIKLMIKQVEQERIGLTCLNDRVKRIKNKTIYDRNKERLSIKPLCSKENSCYKEQPKSKRTMSVIEISNKNKGLNNQPKLEEKINTQFAISPCLPSYCPSTNNNLRAQDYIRSARQKKLFVLECQLNNEINAGQFQPNKAITFKNGAFYEGQLDELNNFNGFGTLFYNLKQICYTGYWKNNRFNGFGYLFNQARKDFNHETHIDYHDFGKDQYEKLWQRYEGEFRDDFKHGYGVLYFINGTKFEGQFANGKVQGSGSFVKVDGQIINGCWHENKLMKQYE